MESSRGGAIVAVELCSSLYYSTVEVGIIKTFS